MDSKSADKVEIVNDTQKLTADDWCEMYLVPVIAVANGVIKPTPAMEDGFSGFILDAILATKDVDGESASDWDCVLMIDELIDFAKRVEL